MQKTLYLLNLSWNIWMRFKQITLHGKILILILPINEMRRNYARPELIQPVPKNA